MGKLRIRSGSGGVSSDEVTALKSHVLAPYTAVTKDSNDEPVAGTMPDRGAWNGTAAMNGSVAIPQGHHNGSGKVNGPSIADRGAWAANIGVNGRVTVPEGYHNGNGSVGQSVAVQGADVAGTDRARATNVSAWGGVMCLGVRNGHYLNGVNWIQGDIPNLQPENIKKGVNMGGLVGTWEGYVANPTDLYYMGDNSAGWYHLPGNMTQDRWKVSFESTFISTKAQYGNSELKWLSANKSIQFAGYRELQLTIMFNYNFTPGFEVELYNSETLIARIEIGAVTVGYTHTFVFPLSSLQTSFVPRITLAWVKNSGNSLPWAEAQIKRIRLV